MVNSQVMMVNILDLLENTMVMMENNLDYRNEEIYVQIERFLLINYLVGLYLGDVP